MANSINTKVLESIYGKSILISLRTSEHTVSVWRSELKETCYPRRMRWCCVAVTGFSEGGFPQVFISVFTEGPTPSQMTEMERSFKLHFLV